MTKRKPKKSKIPPRVYGYARVSTTHQDVAVQCDSIQRYVADNKLGDLLHIYCDEGVSGATEFLDRKRGRLLSDVIRSGDVVVVHKLDRLGRSLLDTISTVHSLIQRGVSLHIVSLPVFGSMDLSTSLGRVVLAVFSIVADLERELIAERTAEGRRLAVAQGYSGGGKPQIGYKVVKRVINGQERSIVEEDPKTQVHLRRILELRKSGLGARQIWFRLKSEGIRNPRTGDPWGITTIQRVITEESV